MTGPINADGLLRGARMLPSPNCDERPDPGDISLVVVHGISLPAGEFGNGHIGRLFTNRLDPGAHPDFGEIARLAVSAHFLVDRGGEITQFVPCARRAWHAGQSAFNGRPACNDFSVGIELEGTDAGGYEDPQYESLSGLCAELIRRYPITGVVGHSDIAPGRKTDPGESFDWERLFSQIGDRHDARA